jgi:hypothetical protein
MGEIGPPEAARSDGLRALGFTNTLVVLSHA